ncbi:hypothetical protein A167_03266 [Alcanivorax sp. S71-1-4]|uniref:hypothetical protein n=1 Tax=Alcanivorax sp. S71-1-4 TaxID=1177159 RepID=UPI0013595D09|nr:hypothetical protein [Alcanivorax sp. S71-1-4]KAF0806253.1 hypothetical protein A167_03266 [Alcanivorax sp. S71-1-4]
MLRILLTCLLLCPVLTWAEEGESSLFQRFSSAMSAMSDMPRKTLYGTLCDQFTDAPACYVTPSGKKVWELDEPERSGWLAIAQSGAEGAPAAVEEAGQDDSPIAATPQALTEEEWATLRQQEAALFCDFWQQQGDSERTREQVTRYCQ